MRGSRDQGRARQLGAAFWHHSNAVLSQIVVQQDSRQYAPRLESVFRDICRIEVEDGKEFQPDSVKGAEIRKEANYAGIRVMLIGVLGSASCSVQIDIGFGDAFVSDPEEVNYPVLLSDMPEPHLRVYPRYTVVAEKLEALTSFATQNSRMKLL